MRAFAGLTALAAVVVAGVSCADAQANVRPPVWRPADEATPILPDEHPRDAVAARPAGERALDASPARHPAGAQRAPRALEPEYTLVDDAACDAHVTLRAALPVLFEDGPVDDLTDVALDVRGPRGLSVRLLHPWADGPVTFDEVKLTQRVALRLPAGPATDAPAGSSGALFDGVGAALAVVGTVVLMPLTLPVALLIGKPETFIIDPPSFSQGMFTDVVLDEATWKAEVARRAAPHAAVLRVEAERQARFAAWKKTLTPPVGACTVDESGHCAMHVRWPASSFRVLLSGLPCTVPPPPPPDAEASTTSAGPTAAPAPTAPTPHAAFLPSRPHAPDPILLDVPERPESDVRGDGARETREAWRKADDVEVSADAVRAGWKGARKPWAPGDIDDATVLCHLETLDKDWDLDGSPPELRVRFAFGYDNNTVGMTFPVTEAWRMDFGLRHVSLKKGELVKVSVVDVDTFVDDWGGMVLTRYEGRSPLHFRHRRFDVECRLVGGSVTR